MSVRSSGAPGGRAGQRIASTRPRRSSAAVVGTAFLLVLVTACGSSTSSARGGANTTPATTPATTPGGHLYVYWDQDEEEAYVNPPANQVHVLQPPWDPNGQMCLLPDNSGRYVVGYDPTNPRDQGENPGSQLKFKDPPIGEELVNRDGTFSGTTYYVPGPYKNTIKAGGSTNNPDVGGDVPPGSHGEFNGNGTYAGCAFDDHGNLWATDIATAQGDFPPPDSGRLVKWFAPDYRQSCIMIGPTHGGVGPHHVDGTGGLAEPGTLAVDGHQLYMPVAATAGAGGPSSGPGAVLAVDTDTGPQRASDCPDQLPSSAVQVKHLISSGQQKVPVGVAIDPTCHCLAVSNVFGGTAVAWYQLDGTPVARPGIASSSNYNPYGLGFLPDGTLYFIDIHVTCSNSGCGTTNNGGGLYRVTFDALHHPTLTREVGEMSFPTSVTVCDGSKQVCPVSPKDYGPPFSEPASKTKGG